MEGLDSLERGEIVQDFEKIKKEEEKSGGVLGSIKKKAGGWARGVTAAVALGLASEAIAHEPTSESAYSQTTGRDEKREISQNEWELSALKLKIVNEIEARKPGSRAIIEKAIQSTLENVKGETPQIQMKALNLLFEKISKKLDAMQESADGAKNRILKTENNEVRINKNERETTISMESTQRGVDYNTLADAFLNSRLINFKGSRIKSESLFIESFTSNLRGLYGKYEVYKKSGDPTLKEDIKRNLVDLVKSVEGGTAERLINPEIRKEFGIE
jgi:hypothetical protein